MADLGPVQLAQAYDLNQARLSDFASMANLRNQEAQMNALKVRAAQKAMADDEQARQIMMRRMQGAGTGATPTTSTTEPGVQSSSPNGMTMGQQRIANQANGLASAAAPGGPNAIMGQMEGFMNDQMGYIQDLANSGNPALRTRAMQEMKNLATTVEKLASTSEKYQSELGKRIDNAQKNLGFVEGVAQTVKDKSSFDRFKLQLLGSGKPLTPLEAQLVSSDWSQAKPLINDWVTNSKTGLENQKLRAQTAQERAAAFASTMRGKLDQIKADQQAKITEDYNSMVTQAKKAGTPDEKIPSFTEWSKEQKGVGGRGSAFERMRSEQIGGAVTELGRSLDIIKKLPVTASGGLFGSMGTKKGFFDAPLNVAANLATKEDERMYNMAASNIGQTIAIIDSGGYKPTQGQIQNYTEKFKWQPTDSVYTKLFAMSDAVAQAEARAKLTLANPSLSSEQRDVIGKVVDSLKKTVPFTPEDLIQARNKGQSIGDFMKDMGKDSGKSKTASFNGKSFTRPEGFTDQMWNNYKRSKGIE